MGNGWSVDTSNHSRGGITASVSLKDWVNNQKQNGIAPIRKARFYGTATNVKNDYADVLQKNGYTYTGADGKTYNSGAYSIVHNKDLIGNRSTQFQYLKNLLKLLKLANKNHRERIFFQSV